MRTEPRPVATRGRGNPASGFAQERTAQMLDELRDRHMGEGAAFPAGAEDVRPQEIQVQGRAGAHADVEPAAGQHVGHREVLGQAEGVLVAHLDDRSTQRDPRGPLRRRGQEDRAGGDAGLKMPLPDPGAVEAQLLAEGEEAQRILQPVERVLVPVIARGQEADMADGWSRHR